MRIVRSGGFGGAASSATGHLSDQPRKHENTKLFRAFVLSWQRTGVSGPASGSDTTDSVLNRDNPVPSHIYRQFFVQAFDERGAVLVEEGDEPDGPFLRVAVGECQRACVHELTTKGFVAPLGGLNHLAMQCLKVVLHSAQRRSGGPFE